MKGVIHQPHFFPWLGYFNKLANIDIFIVQDNVQYRERYFQNRTLILDINKKTSWLTLPVTHNRNSLIVDVIPSNKYWKLKLVNSLFNIYKNEIYFDKYFDNICISIFDCPNDLVSININLIKYFLNIFQIEIEILKASSFEKKENATKNLVNLCQINKIDKYIFGEGGGLSYHGINSFKYVGIDTYKQNFKQYHTDNEIAFHNGIFNLSVLEYIFKMDINEIIKIVKRNTIKPTSVLTKMG